MSLDNLVDKTLEKIEPNASVVKRLLSSARSEEHTSELQSH